MFLETKLEIKGRGKFLNGNKSGLLAWENDDYVRTNNFLRNYGEQYKKKTFKYTRYFKV